LVKVIDAVSARLTSEALRELDGQVRDGRTTQAVAATWLEQQQP
jgi:glycine betaine/choline ABC-type transport system substrate-binding protein